MGVAPATEGANEGRGKTTVVYYRPELASYVLRAKKLLELGDAYIVFNGGTGTISEFAMAWGLARLYFGHRKPLLLYGDFWPHLIADLQEHMLIRPDELEVIRFVNSPAEVLAAVDKNEVILAANRHDHTSCDNPECVLLL